MGAKVERLIQNGVPVKKNIQEAERRKRYDVKESKYLFF